MHARRGLAVLTVAAALLSGVFPVSAQVDEAERRADEASGRVEQAHAVVTEAVADREAVEAALFAALDEYATAAAELTEASVRLQQITESLAFADAEAISAEVELESHTVNAYMEAVAGAASVLLDAGNMEDALVVGHVVRESQSDALATLADLITQRNELQRIREAHAAEVTEVTQIESMLADAATRLEELFATANADVSAAYTAARTADEEYRAALDDVDRAIAQEEAARKAAEAATTTTAPPSTTTAPPATTPPTTGNGSTSTTSTTTAPAEWPPIPISDRVYGWRPLVEQHFAPDLALDALVIIQCESLGYADAVNPYSGASGLFQFMPGTWAVASVQAGVGDRSVFDGEANIIAASWLAEYYRGRLGEPWRPWSCRRYL